MRKIFVSCAILALTLMVGTASAVVTELVTNGGLENWTGLVPDGWDMTNRDALGAVNGTPNYTISIETSDLRAGTPGTQALLCTRTVSDSTFRYFAFTNTINPIVGNGSYSGWQKGDNCRAYRAFSTDSGTTWEVDNVTALGGVTAPTNWTNVTATITAMQTPGELYKIAFHSFSFGTTIEARIDDISLIGDDGTVPPLSIVSVSPPTSIYQSGTFVITATPGGGSGVYNQVEFDIGNNGSIDHTDTTAPFEYSWNTAASQPGKGVVAVKMIVTDNTLATGNSIFNFTVDNRYGGRIEHMTNSNFDSFQLGNPNLPTDWVENDVVAGVTYGPDPDNHDANSTPSLQVTFASFNAANRLSLRWAGFANSTAVYEDHQVTYWGKGLNCALRYMTSDDSGATWTDTGLTAATAGTPDWLFCIGLVQPTLASNIGDMQTIATVGLELKALYDDISWKTAGTPIPAGASTSWSIYE